MDKDTLELYLMVKGKVQGVFFRATAKDFANKLGVKGTVKNLDDGSVEIYAQGTAENLSSFITELEERFEGNITHMDKKYSKPNLSYEYFQILY